MASPINKLLSFARSPQGQRAINQARQKLNTPQNQQKARQAMQRLTQRRRGTP